MELPAKGRSFLSKRLLVVHPVATCSCPCCLLSHHIYLAVTLWQARGKTRNNWYCFLPLQLGTSMDRNPMLRTWRPFNKDVLRKVFLQDEKRCVENLSFTCILEWLWRQNSLGLRQSFCHHHPRKSLRTKPKVRVKQTKDVKNLGPRWLCGDLTSMAKLPLLPDWLFCGMINALALAAGQLFCSLQPRVYQLGL